MYNIDPLSPSEFRYQFLKKLQNIFLRKNDPDAFSTCEDYIFSDFGDEYFEFVGGKYF